MDRLGGVAMLTLSTIGTVTRLSSTCFLLVIFLTMEQLI
jgi:hypothetical protein